MSKKKYSKKTLSEKLKHINITTKRGFKKQTNIISLNVFDAHFPQEDAHASYEISLVLSHSLMRPRHEAPPYTVYPIPMMPFRCKVV